MICLDGPEFKPHREKHGLVEYRAFGSPSLVIGCLEIWLARPVERLVPGRLLLLAAVVGDGAQRLRVPGGGEVSLDTIASAHDGLTRLLQGTSGEFVLEGFPNGLFAAAAALGNGCFRVESGVRRQGDSGPAMVLIDEQSAGMLKAALHDCQDVLKKFGAR